MRPTSASWTTENAKPRGGRRCPPRNRLGDRPGHGDPADARPGRSGRPPSGSASTPSRAATPSLVGADEPPALRHQQQVVLWKARARSSSRGFATATSSSRSTGPSAAQTGRRRRALIDAAFERQPLLLALAALCGVAGAGGWPPRAVRVRPGSCAWCSCCCAPWRARRRWGVPAVRRPRPERGRPRLRGRCRVRGGVLHGAGRPAARPPVAALAAAVFAAVGRTSWTPTTTSSWRSGWRSPPPWRC